MKFALVNGQREEARPQLAGQCPYCQAAMVAKCGEVRVPHWAHKGRRLCDPWWENETEWHRDWKNQFPAHWQEQVHVAEDGERHIADVKTASGWVIEFQHSHLRPEERRSREGFYRRLLWVVDATGPRHKSQLESAWREGLQVGSVRKVLSVDRSVLQKWAGSNVPVFYDVGPEGPLVWLFTRSGSDWAYLAVVSRGDFIQNHPSEDPAVGEQFEKLVRDIRELIALHESAPRHPPLSWGPTPGPRRRPFRF